MSAEKEKPLGNQELKVLLYIADEAPVSARRVALWFGAEMGWARSTVLTVMERLRQKGYLTRQKRGTVFYYSPRRKKNDVLETVVRQFVENTLGGAVSPVVAYLTRHAKLSPQEQVELKGLIQDLRKREAATARRSTSRKDVS